MLQTKFRLLAHNTDWLFTRSSLAFTWNELAELAGYNQPPLSNASIQSDQRLWHSLRIRRRQADHLTGLDATANKWINRIRLAKSGVSHLKSKADKVVAQEKQWAELREGELDLKLMDLRDAFSAREVKDDMLVAGFAAIREVAYRETGERPYQVQIMGALGLYLGQIVEMVTGEGKTLTASLAATALGWRRKPVHVITVNDYLAARDAEGRSPIYRRAGLKAVSIVAETPDHERGALYQQNVIYVTQKELVADWLRDQLKLGRIMNPVSTRWMASGRSAASQILVPGLFYAIVDEADAVLIDEAVTPLIIAQPRQVDPSSTMYNRARAIAMQLEYPEHYDVELAKRRCELTASGREKVTQLLTEEDHGIWKAIRRREELVESALTAEHCYILKVQYQIVEDKIVIVDEYTGRFMNDRQWQHGLHQAVEAKHNLSVTADRDTLASLSFQRFFKLYPHLCGMTGTAADASSELEETYGLPVRIIPTHRPIQRKLHKTQIYANEALKWSAVVNRIQELHLEGRPILVGTRSIEASETLSERLSAVALRHQVLNAIHHKEEADIVSKAGQPGAITVATNMAGRGTDIKLGPGVKEIGGLAVILTERHTSRRVDRQLFGRAGRQGDPGSAQVIISLEDDLLLKHAPVKSKLVRKMFQGRTTPLPATLERLFDRAQKQAQNVAFKSRAQVLKQDEELDRTLPR
jgi:preprotein translocase subunit SecA